MMTENTLSNVMAEQVLPQEKNAILFVGYADPDSPAGLLKATPEGELVKMSFLSRDAATLSSHEFYRRKKGEADRL